MGHSQFMNLLRSSGRQPICSRMPVTRNQKWEDNWIEQAENLVHEEYHANYEKKSTSVEPIQEMSTTGFLSFRDLSVATCPHASEIQEYLSLPVELVKDPLK
jgi:hypothetical protein